jgi:hypothetical protein
MKVITTLLSAVPVPLISAHFHRLGSATKAVEPDTERLPGSPEPWMDEARVTQLMTAAMYKLMMR